MFLWYDEACVLQVAGTSGKVRLDESEEEGLSTEAHGAAIIEALGLDRRNQATTAPELSIH